MNLEGTGAQLLPRFTSSSAQNDFIGKCQLGLNRPVVVGLIGKSWQGKGVLGNILTDRAVFEPLELQYGPSDSSEHKAKVGLELYHDSELNCIFLNLISLNDSLEFINEASKLEQFITEATSTAQAHQYMHSQLSEEMKYILYLFLVSHIILITSPVPRVDLSWTKILRAVQFVKDPILKPLQSLLATAVSAKRIDVAEQSIATPFAPVKWAPTLAFVYDDTSILPLLAAKADAKKDPSKANKSDKRGGGRNAEAAQGEETGGKKKESAHAKLQQALENQVRSLYKRLRTDNAPKLYQLDINQAAHLVTFGGEPYLSPSCDIYLDTPVFSDSLRTLLYDDANKIHIRSWLSSKVEWITQSAKNQKTELLTARSWFSVANFVREFVVFSANCSSDDQSNLAKLSTLVSPEMQFAEETCKMATNIARSIYFAELPAQYTKTFHQKRVEGMRQVFFSVAQGPLASARFESLFKECESYWRNGHQRCDAVSVTHRPCVFSFHALPSDPVTTTDNASVELKRMEHSSGYRTFNACNCGKTRRIREDPFELRSANVDFFRADCCVALPSLLQSESKQSLPIRTTITDNDQSSDVPLAITDESSTRLASWSALVLGPASLYNAEKGLAQDGFLPGYNTMLPWDFSISKMKAKGDNSDDAVTTATTIAGHLPQDGNKTSKRHGSRSNKQNGGKNRRNQHRQDHQHHHSTEPAKESLADYVGQVMQQKDIKRCYVGIEYECPLGHRWFLSNEPIATALNLKMLLKNGKVDVAKLLTEHEIGVYLPCVCGKNNSLAQLQRIYIVTPDVSPISTTANPVVRFTAERGGGGRGERVAFSPGAPILLPESSLVCIRLPYIFSTPKKTLVQRSSTAPYKVTLLPNVLAFG